eukprot:GHVQ01041766.1.p1 GENE.GHVQ01041766.1~~GHVQ01041766.1.p1  ORF type:complete len:250 (-),score=52.93 GHVQ01041766.1:212-961(-)
MISSRHMNTATTTAAATAAATAGSGSHAAGTSSSRRAVVETHGGGGGNKGVGVVVVGTHGSGGRGSSSTGERCISSKLCKGGSNSSSVGQCGPADTSSDSLLIVSMPCYMLLWRYELRQSLNSVHRGGCKWIVVQAQFVPTKWFGNDYEVHNGGSEAMQIAKIHVLDQLRTVRTRESAKVLSWCLAGCLEQTLSDMGVEGFCVKEIREDGEWQGFPEMTMSDCDIPRQKVLQQLSDMNSYVSMNFFTAR